MQSANAIYHLLNRADRREPIFADDADRERFLTTLVRPLRMESAGRRFHVTARGNELSFGDIIWCP